MKAFHVFTKGLNRFQIIVAPDGIYAADGYHILHKSLPLHTVRAPVSLAEVPKDINIAAPTGEASDSYEYLKGRMAECNGRQQPAIIAWRAYRKAFALLRAIESQPIHKLEGAYAGFQTFGPGKLARLFLAKGYTFYTTTKP